MTEKEAARTRYLRSFYLAQQDGSLQSAARVLPFVFDLVRPKSVCDFGCGVGSWLSIAKQLGCTDVLGIDGLYIDLDLLRIDQAEFLPHDFDEPLSPPRHFDLAMSLEVAEHLEDRLADRFLDSIVTAAPIVLFSAAVPGQGGTNHVNERWPSYWIKKFEQRNYAAYDCLRPVFWSDRNVKWWYRQNMFLFVDQSSGYELSSKLVTSRIYSGSPMINLVHPGRISHTADSETSGL